MEKWSHEERIFLLIVFIVDPTTVKKQDKMHFSLKNREAVKLLYMLVVYYALIPYCL